MNVVILCGRLTKEPENKMSQNGNSLTRYSLAVDRKRKDDNGTDFFNIVAFGKSADFAANYFHKGMRVLIEGHIQTNTYLNREGVKVNSFDIVADSQEFADGKQESPKRRQNMSQSVSRVDGQGMSQSVSRVEDEFDWMNVADDADEGLPF